MGEIDCLKACSSCSRHVRCHERACPFCGAALAFFMRVPEYRLKTRVGRGVTFGLGAALGAIGIALGCSESNAMALYGGACAAPECLYASDAGTAIGASGGTGGLDINVMNGEGGEQNGGEGGEQNGGAGTR